ncbi:MAG: AarF/UbiB family protein, partial [Elsteraceae bacterium]
MLDHPRSLLRLMGIAATLARHDALSPLVASGLLPRPFGLLQWFAKREETASRPGQRLAKAAVALGPTFIKAGQLLSTRADIVGETAAADLAELQDRLPPFPFEQVRRTIEEAFGCPMEQLYRAFDPVPVAAASIAQVHFAETIDGELVAVKVLRPDIESWFARDLRLFALIAESLEKVRPDLRRLKPRLVVEQFGKDLKFETDLRFEAAAAAELAENFAGDPGFRVPKVDWRRTAKRVLTLERVAGERVDDPATLVATGRDPRKVMENAANAFFNQVFRDGFFHADMHPGNSFVAEDNAIIAIDFGIMGRLDRQTRYFLADMLMAFLSGDYRKVAEVHFAAGYVPPDQSIEAFTQACRSIGEPLLGRPLQEISVGRLLAQLFEVTETFQMETQPQ